MIQSRLFLLRDINFIQGALSDLNFAGCFHLIKAVTHCMNGNIQKSIKRALKKK